MFHGIQQLLSINTCQKLHLSYRTISTHRLRNGAGRRGQVGLGQPRLAKAFGSIGVFQLGLMHGCIGCDMHACYFVIWGYEMVHEILFLCLLDIIYS